MFLGKFLAQNKILLSLQRHLQNMLFYHKGLRGRKTLPFVACARKAAIVRGNWSAHESDVVGLLLQNCGNPVVLSPIIEIVAHNRRRVSDHRVNSLKINGLIS